MSEHQRKHHEKLLAPELPEQKVPHDSQEHLKALEKEAQTSRHEHQEQLEAIKAVIEDKAEESSDVLSRTESREKDASHEPSSGFINKELKDLAYNRSLIRIRKKLSVPDKALSAIIHQPFIDTVSTIGSKTIARPSGLFGAALAAFTGGTGYFLLVKHYGYEYNFFVFIGLLIAGFAFGLLVELASRVLRLKKHR